jgi:MFS family permease
MTFLPLLATQIVGVEATEVGILFTIGGLSSLVLGIPLGMLADRLGKRTLMILGLVVSGGAMAGIAFAQSYPLLILFTIVNGLGAVMFTPAALGLLSEMVPSHKQSTAMGLYGGICEDSGIIAGSALGGFVWSALGPQPTFLIGAIASGVGALISFRLIGRRDRCPCSQ